MKKTRTAGPVHREILNLELDRTARPMHRQIYLALRAAILGGALPQGTYVPATRVLTRQLACSRTTVLKAYEQLIAEGYLESIHGSGTRVAQISGNVSFPVDLHRALRAASVRPAMPTFSKRGNSFMREGARLLELDAPAFTMTMTDVESFPFDVWARLYNRVWRRPDPAMVRGQNAAGHPALRRAIAEYLSVLRGAHCTAEQVLITSGATHAIDLLSRALIDRGDKVWVEEPGYHGWRVMRASGATLVPVPVDDSGLRVREGERLAPDARLAAVTPSHQYPLGCVLSLSRRLELLDWARRSRAWIIEDDYKCEFRYTGSPLSPIQSLDEEGRVVYVGTFSKIMFPALRLGYIVGSREMIDRLAHARRFLDLQTSVALQPVMAEFMNEGHFMMHVRKVRRLYARRQQAMLDAARHHLNGLLEVRPQPAGLHLLGLFEPPLAACVSDSEASKDLAMRGIAARPLSGCYLRKAARHGLLLGYAALDEDLVDTKIEELATALRRFIEPRRKRAGARQAALAS